MAFADGASACTDDVDECYDDDDDIDACCDSCDGNDVVEILQSILASDDKICNDGGILIDFHKSTNKICTLSE